MTALLLITATSCSVIILPSLPQCWFVAQTMLHFGTVFCVPVGVAT